MKKLNIIKVVEVGDAEFQITLPTGGTVNVTAREVVAPGKARIALGGENISGSMTLQCALAKGQTAKLVLMNADDLTEMLNALSYNDIYLMS